MRTPLRVTAMATGNAGTVANLYADYFSKDFLPRRPQGTITESHIRILDGRRMIVEHHSSAAPS